MRVCPAEKLNNELTAGLFREAAGHADRRNEHTHLFNYGLAMRKCAAWPRSRPQLQPARSVADVDRHSVRLLNGCALYNAKAAATGARWHTQDQTEQHFRLNETWLAVMGKPEGHRQDMSLTPSFSVEQAKKGNANHRRTDPEHVRKPFHQEEIFGQLEGRSLVAANMHPHTTRQGCRGRPGTRVIAKWRHRNESRQGRHDRGC